MRKGMGHGLHYFTDKDVATDSLRSYQICFVFR